MMVPFLVVLTVFVLQNSAFPEDYNYGIADDLPETDNWNNIGRRNSNFLRFGRSGKDLDFADYDLSNDFARPTRSGNTEKNDHFIRFGRGEDYLRFGRDPQRRIARDKTSNYLRFGRSVTDKKRAKRDVEKMSKKGNGSNFLRFGRNSNFLRFGRQNDAFYEEKLMQLLELLEMFKKNDKC